MTASPEAFLQAFQNIVVGLNDGINTLIAGIAAETAAINAIVATYGQGVWTPQLAFGESVVGITYLTQVGTYTKVGREFVCRFRMQLASKGSATGPATILGLPAVLNPDQTSFGAGGLVPAWGNMSLVTGPPLLSGSPGKAEMRLVNPFPPGPTADFLYDGQFSDNSELDGFFTFFT